MYETSLKHAAIKLEEIFYSNTPCILYIPAGCKQIPEAVLNQPWSCVYTSSYGMDVANSFLIDGKRSVKVYTQHDEITTDLVLSKIKLPIVYLNGINESDYSNLEFRENQLRQAEIKKMLVFAQDILKNNYGHFVALGYSPEKPGEVSIQYFYDAFCMARKGTLLLFSAENVISNPDASGYINDLVEHEQMLYYINKLEDALDLKDENTIDENDYYTDDQKSEQTDKIGIGIF